MFEAELKSKTMKAIVDSILDLSDASVVFDISEDGINVQAMDTSHVSLCIMKLTPEGFDSYNCTEHYNVGVNIANLSKILKFASINTQLVMGLHDEDKMNITLKDESSKCEFELNLMNIDAESLSVPEMDNECEIKMSSSKFQKLCKDLSSMGEECTISVDEDSAYFETIGDSMKAKSLFSKEDNDISFNGKHKSKYALRYLQSFSKAYSLAEVVVMKLTQDCPVNVEYNLGKLGYLRYYLAPKIEDDDDM